MTKVSGQLLVLHTQILSTSMFACNASYTWTTVTVRRTQSALPIHSFDRDNLHTKPIFINTRRYHIALYSCIGLYGSIFGKRDLLAIDHIMLAYFGVMFQIGNN